MLEILIAKQKWLAALATNAIVVGAFSALPTLAAEHPSSLADSRSNKAGAIPPATRRSEKTDQGSELIGQKCPEFVGLKFLDNKPHTLKEFAGHPVLIRFWNQYCSMCEAAAPVLDELYSKYSPKGLVVIGIHHKKTKAPDTEQSVRATAKSWKMPFLIGIDNDWQTVNRIWMNKHRGMTSATLLVGKDGRILWVHPGGVLEKSSPEVGQLEKLIKADLSRGVH